tara:strand:+ start:445 stop:945 length:501 start_codon:yes stop_codon:yes gene_type:complete
MQQNFSDPISDVKVRQAALNDIPKIIDINLKTLPENYSNSFYEDILINYPETFIVAENDEKIIGYIMCRIEYGLSNIRTLNLARKGHIVSIALLEECRNKGIGTELLKMSIEGMKKRNCKESYLEVRSNNFNAIKVYEKFGFTKNKTMDNYYRDNSSALLMSFEII